jgi:hypothetical protein
MGSCPQPRTRKAEDDTSETPMNLLREITVPNPAGFFSQITVSSGGIVDALQGVRRPETFLDRMDRAASIAETLRGQTGPMSGMRPMILERLGGRHWNGLSGTP